MNLKAQETTGTGSDATAMPGKKHCVLEGNEYPHGSEVSGTEDYLICINGTWVNKDDLVSVGC